MYSGVLEQLIKVNDTKAEIRKWIYVNRKSFKVIQTGAYTIGGWFIIAGVAEYIGDTGNYNPNGAVIIGGSIIAAGQIARLFKWKKYHIEGDITIKLLSESPLGS